jgi:two-component system, OmpR family, response regulator VicR
MRILVIEDDEMVRMVIEHKLKKEEYDVDHASDGKQGADKIRENTYDLILTDLLIPFFSGLELINLVRNQLKLNTPIIVLSLLSNEDTIIEAFKLGADDYLTKPFSPNELSIRVKRLLLKK